MECTGIPEGINTVYELAELKDMMKALQKSVEKHTSKLVAVTHTIGDLRDNLRKDMEAATVKACRAVQVEEGTITRENFQQIVEQAVLPTIEQKIQESLCGPLQTLQNLSAIGCTHVQPIPSSAATTEPQLEVSRERPYDRFKWDDSDICAGYKVPKYYDLPHNKDTNFGASFKSWHFTSAVLDQFNNTRGNIMPIKNLVGGDFSEFQYKKGIVTCSNKFLKRRRDRLSKWRRVFNEMDNFVKGNNPELFVIFENAESSEKSAMWQSYKREAFKLFDRDKDVSMKWSVSYAYDHLRKIKRARLAEQ